MESYGECLPDNRFGLEDFGGDADKMSSSYLFNLAWENSYGSDYVTEKVWRAMNAGAVPLYTGTPDIFSFLPSGWSGTDSVIYVDQFYDFATDTMKDLKKFADYLHYLSNNLTAYAELHEWRRQPLPRTFLKLAAMAEDGGELMDKHCRLCNCARGMIGCNLTAAMTDSQ